MSYKLLVFNEDLYDGCIIGAQAIFTDEQYEQWRETTQGEANPKYDTEIVAYNLQEKLQKSFTKTMMENGFPDSVYVTIPSDREDLIKLKQNYLQKRKYITEPMKMYTDVNTYLDYGDDNLEALLAPYVTFGDIVDDGLVSVTDVDENFRTIFRQSGLEAFSTCDIFAR